MPVPPKEEETEYLHVEVGRSVSWRLRVALFQLESEGEKTTKRAFVEEALVAALDTFDRKR